MHAANRACRSLTFMVCCSRRVLVLEDVRRTREGLLPVPHVGRPFRAVRSARKGRPTGRPFPGVRLTVLQARAALHSLQSAKLVQLVSSKARKPAQFDIRPLFRLQCGRLPDAIGQEHHRVARKQTGLHGLVIQTVPLHRPEERGKRVRLYRWQGGLDTADR